MYVLDRVELGKDHRMRCDPVVVPRGCQLTRRHTICTPSNPTSPLNDTAGRAISKATKQALWVHPRLAV